MKIFNFSKNAVDLIIKEIHNANEFIYIALFQIHNKKIFDILLERLSKGVQVRVLTLPLDSIKDKIRAEVEGYFKEIEKYGAKLYCCKWNVGDPGRTTTAVGRWYLFHGKFIITDTAAIALSANFTMKTELDSFIIFREQEKIIEFKQKFEELLDLYITNYNGYDGSIRQKIEKESGDQSIFLPPKEISNIHEKNWIKHYPIEICPKNVAIEDRLYITPFDCRGRDFYISVIDEAEDFVYLTTESFTDVAFSSLLAGYKAKGIDIKILTGSKSQDFQDRSDRMFKGILALNINIRTMADDLHAKMIITEKRVLITSINLNKIDLGFDPIKKYWRENTETITVCSDNKIIKQAKEDFQNIFSQSRNIEDILVEKIAKTIHDIFKINYKLKTKPEAESIFAKFILKKELQALKTIMDISKITAKLMYMNGKSVIEKNDLFLSLILFYLTEKKCTFDELYDKLSILNIDLNLLNLLTSLIKNNLIEKEEDYYKIKITKLFDGV